MRVPDTLAEALERFVPVIGLEVHAQLTTRSKLFSRAPNRYEPLRPNRCIEAYCLGLPGVLPVLNERAVEMAVRAGLALGCTIRERSIFSRKQYFYPDLPKGYQISQYDQPLCENGALDITADDGGTRRVHIVRIHMEEDAGKSTHVAGARYSLVDYNRAGVPLVEIVSAPDLRSAEESSRYLKLLRSILMTLDVCDGNMEEGSFRCDANISVRPRGSEVLGTRAEIKNVNSFRYVQQAIDHEVLRQSRLVARGEAVEQETRLYDSARRETRPMRTKEEAHDYRYFPDPDLPPLVIERAWIEDQRKTLPELPAQKLERWMALGVPEEHARAFSEEREVAVFFDAAVALRPSSALGIANLIKGELLRELKEAPEGALEQRLRPEDVAELAALREADRISSTQEKKILHQMWQDGVTLEALLEREGGQIDDPSALLPVIQEVLARSPKEVEEYRKGKTKVLGYLVGQVMKATRGKAKPTLVQDLVKKALET